jgi:hypothetical protein
VTWQKGNAGVQVNQGEEGQQRVPIAVHDLHGSEVHDQTLAPDNIKAAILEGQLDRYPIKWT